MLFFLNRPGYCVDVSFISKIFLSLLHVFALACDIDLRIWSWSWAIFSRWYNTYWRHRKTRAETQQLLSPVRLVSLSLFIIKNKDLTLMVTYLLSSRAGRVDDDATAQVRHTERKKKRRISYWVFHYIKAYRRWARIEGPAIFSLSVFSGPPSL